ncbi:MAG TPA: DUF5337 family protein [Albidovulum sp.]|nr:DUF5337 family protein [Albidovulum sp.]
MAGGRDQALVREAQMVAVVIAATAILWLVAQWLVEPGNRLMVLFDLAAMAAFFWALVATWRIWRRTTRPNGN